MHAPKKRTELTAESLWWPRFSRYELSGSLVRPALDASVTYLDLRKVAAEDLFNNEARAYESLGATLSKVPSDSSGWPRRALEQAEQEAVLSWCAEYGLLGLFHHKAHVVVLAARKREDVDYSGENPGSYRVPYQISYARSGRGWSTYSVADETGAPADTDLDLSDERVAKDRLALPTELDEFFQRPRADVQELGQLRVEILSLTDALGRYLPNVPTQVLETAYLPNPSSEAFWREYAEPLDEFVRAFNLLTRAVIFLQGDGAKDGAALVESLLEPVRFGVRPRHSDIPAQQLLTPTLLSALAVAVTRATADGRRSRECHWCGRLFFTNKKLGRYCSGQHARAAQNYRMRVGTTDKAKKPRRKANKTGRGQRR